MGLYKCLSQRTQKVNMIEAERRKQVYKKNKLTINNFDNYSLSF